MFRFILLVVLARASLALPVLSSGEVSLAHDTLGNYNLRYAIDGISRSELRDSNGNINGGFSYYDPHGILRKTEFTSGSHGFNAFGPDIPQPVLDTPEVAIAKSQHLAILRAAYQEAALHPRVIPDGLPQF